MCVSFLFYIGIVCCTFFLLSGHTFNGTASLNVLANPIVFITPSNLTVEEENQFTILCLAHVPVSGNPSNLAFTWFKRNGTMNDRISNNTGKSIIRYHLNDLVNLHISNINYYYIDMESKMHT